MRAGSRHERLFYAQQLLQKLLALFGKSLVASDLADRHRLGNVLQFLPGKGGSVERYGIGVTHSAPMSDTIYDAKVAGRV